MNNLAVEDVVGRSKHLAQLCFERGNYGKAFAHLLVALKLDPECKNEFKLFFSSVLCAWGKILESQGRFTDLFKCYDTATEIFPENEVVLTNLGAHLLRLQHYNEAQHYFEEALKVNYNYLPAYRNLQNVKNCLVERWHYRMLNDCNRNEAFRKAIHKKIQKGFKSMLDIGTGSGLLSLYAREGGAKSLYACDYSKTMIDIANKVMCANSCNSIKLINKLSDNLKIPEDVPSRLSFIVTETVDAGLLGEHILQTVLNAWENLLIPQNGDNCMNKRVVPHGAVLYMTPIECTHIGRKKNVFRKIGRQREFLNRIDNIIIEASSLKSFTSEPYDTENLKLVSDGYDLLSETKQAFYFDFNDPLRIKKYICDGVSKKLSFRCTTSGYIDAIAVWFDLLIDDEIHLSTSPKNSQESCWDQAVFLNKDFLFVENGMLIEVIATFESGKLSVNVNDVQHHEELLCKDGNEPKKGDLNCQSSMKFIVSDSIIAFLNDEPLIEALIGAKKSFCNKKKKIMKILDLSPVPILGLLLGKELGSEVTCFVKSETDIDFISDLLQKNNMKPTSVELKLYDELSNFSCDEIKYDVVFPNLFELTGELNEDVLDFIPKIWKYLKDDAAILPSYIDVFAQLVHSEWLSKCSLVQNESLNNEFVVAKFINNFKVSQCIDLKLQNIPFQEMSEKVKICKLTLEELCNSTSLIFENIIATSNAGLINAAIYWFEYEICGTKISTFQPKSHINQAAELFIPAIHVSEQTNMKLKLTYNLGILRFELINELIP